MVSLLFFRCSGNCLHKEKLEMSRGLSPCVKASPADWLRATTRHRQQLCLTIMAERGLMPFNSTSCISVGYPGISYWTKPASLFFPSPWPKEINYSGSTNSFNSHRYTRPFSFPRCHTILRRHGHDFFEACNSPTAHHLLHKLITLNYNSVLHICR